MKKIMFNDKYGLTDAVLEGRKTMTRRLAPSGATLTESRYQVGEIIAVAQSYKDAGYAHDAFIEKRPGWRNKMFVGAEFMPHQIRITDVRIERLQDISDEDCLREGIRQMTFDTFSFDSWKFFTRNPREAFAALIDKVSGNGTWESNPYVFVYSFELVK